MISRVARFDGDKGTATSSGNPIMGDQLTFYHGPIRF
jgi:hypothetical protein